MSSIDSNKYIGIPFIECGRTKAGIDCWGLVCLVYREQLGIELPTFSDEYMSLADRQALVDIVEGNLSPWTEISAGQEQAGDGLLMMNGGLPTHMGVVVMPGKVLHIERGAGAVVQDYFRPQLARRIVGFFRYESARKI